MSRDINDVERGAEGQDTITPLTNSAFLKQLSKLKHYTGSVRSVNSTNSSSDPATPTDGKEFDAQSFKSRSSINSNQSRKNRTPANLLSLFRTHSKSSRLNLDELISSNLEIVGGGDNGAELLHAKTYQPPNTPTISFAHLSSSNSTSNNRADKLVDVLNSIIINSNNDSTSDLKQNELLNNLRLLLKHSEMMKRQKLDKSIFICRLFIFFFFLLMFLMICYFLKTIHSISNNFLKVEQYEHQFINQFNNSSYLNLPVSPNI